MGKVLGKIDDELGRWIESQPLCFVATAPLARDGHLNVSPKGGAGLFRVLGPHRFAYLDLFGSGIETVAHLQENGRIVVMFAAFDGPPKIIRLHGHGRAVDQRDDDYAQLLAEFAASEPQRLSARSVIVVEVTRVSSSCGFVVPEMHYEGERRQLYRYAEARIAADGPAAIRDYCDERNAVSIDGFRGLTPFRDQPYAGAREDRGAIGEVTR